MKILIAVPTFENICVETFKSIYNMDKGGHDVVFDSVKGYDCAKARNEIGKRTLEGGYDAVLMVDSDIILPNDALVNLTEITSDVTLGCYPHKNTTSHEVELFRIGQPNYETRYTYDTMPNQSRIIVKGGGFGCALVRAHVFNKVPYPWFQYKIYTNGEHLSEDLYFCSAVNKHHLRIEADTRVRCGHLHKHFQYD